MIKNAFIIGAYVSSISLRNWDEQDETLFFRELRARPKICGLEHAFYGRLHRYDDDWFLKNISPDWDFVFTCLPGTVDTLKINPAIGLASREPQSQQQALEFIFEANRAVKKLNATLGRESVIAVQIHSAPAQNASKEAFAKALQTIASWDWEGAKLLVEHCDTFRSDGTHAKGFLKLEEEIWAIRKVEKPKTKMGMMLNWGRSSVEGRNTTHILDQIAILKQERLLKGFIFSGTTVAFKDKHTPSPTPNQGKIDCAESLMTLEEIKKSLKALPLDDLDYLGLKVMPQPISEDCRKNLVYIDHLLEVLAYEALYSEA